MTTSGSPKGSPPRKRWSARCWWDSSLSPRNHIDAGTARARAIRRYGRALSTGANGSPDGSRHQQEGEQRTLTTSEFSGRSRPTTRLYRRRSGHPIRRGLDEHFGRGDHFANVHPIYTHLQGMNASEDLTALTCRYSPTRRHRVPLTAVQCRHRRAGPKKGAPNPMTASSLSPSARSAVCWHA